MHVASQSSHASPVIDFQTVDVIGLPVAVTTYQSAIDWIREKALAADRAYAIEAANTHVAAMARHLSEFGEVMQQFDLIVPDGMPLVWSINRALKKKGKKCSIGRVHCSQEDADANQAIHKLTDRVYGPTLMLRTIEASEGNPRLKHFFLGGAPSTLAKLDAKFAKENPAAQIVGSYSPPFGEWPEGEFEKIKQLIEASGATLVWVGLGCPKQERWIANHKDELPPACYFGIGAAFAFHAGEVAQAPVGFQKLGLEWAYRLCKEPKRLLKRYFKYNGLFLWYAIANYFRMNISIH